MFCDSAYLYQETNSLDAYGTIRIVQGDSINITGDFLKYDGNLRQAKITGNVVMTDRKMVLTSNILNYNLNNETADYNDGGKIVDGDNILTSRRGYYYSNERMLFFRDSVLLNNPKYFVTSDTLKYHTGTKIAYFPAATYIHSLGSDSALIYCESGWYNTVTGKSTFKQNAYIQSKENKLSGDSLSYDQNSGIGRAFGNVNLIDTLQKVIISGDLGFNDNKKKYSFVTGNSILTKIFETDSLFLHADTLHATEDTVMHTRTWIACHKVRIYKSDLQGKCDSLVYSTGDSTLKFFNEPVLWSEQNQLTAEFMDYSDC